MIRSMVDSKVSAAFVQSVENGVQSIVYLPEGNHQITATKNGQPAKLDVSVDSECLAYFAQDLTDRQSQNVRPFAGFDHKPGPASFIPLEFRYEDGLGLVLDVEWTSAGKEAIEGKTYSYFSPTFLLGKDNKPIGLPDNGEIGSLVNDPAFQSIPRIAANSTLETMKELLEALIELGLVSNDVEPENALESAKAYVGELKKKAEEKTVIEAPNQDEVMAARVAAESALVEANSTIAALRQENDGLKQSLESHRDAEIESVIAEAVQAGRIAPQDEQTVSFWKSSIKANPEAVHALRAIPGKDLTTPVIKKRAEQSPTASLKGIEKVEAAFKAQSQES